MIKHTAKRRAFAQRPCPIRITPFHKRVANRRFCNSAAFMIAQGKNGAKTQIGSITAVRKFPGGCLLSKFRERQRLYAVSGRCRRSRRTAAERRVRRSAGRRTGARRCGRGRKGSACRGKSASPEQIRSFLRRRTRRAGRVRRARCRPGARARRRAGKTRRAC